MTLAVGVSCPEGAVIAADHMLFSHSSGGDWRWHLSSKIHRLDRWHGAFVCYGVQGLDSLDRNSFFETVAVIQAGAFGISSVIPHDPSEQAGTLAAGTDGDVVRLLQWNGGDCKVAPDVGAVFLMGYAALWTGSIEQPTTIGGCLGLALSIAVETVYSEYAKTGGATLNECLALNKVPGVAFPIDYAILRPGRVEFFVCPS